MKKSILFATACLASIPAVSFAQEAAPEVQSDEIIVTATLRASNVQDIPLAVTALSPETLETQGVQDIKTLSAVTPSFNIQSSQTETGGTSIRIRGVGTTGNNAGLESSVGVFIDGVYQSRPGVALGDLVDLERLEVLRGPQGTLFGRNTSAGALSITTKRPSLSEFSGYANATVGNYNLINVQAGAGGPITDTLGWRLTGAVRQRDGFLESPSGNESNNRDRYSARGQILFEPTPAVSLRIIADYSNVDEQCCDAVIVRESELAATAAFHGLSNDGVVQSGLGALDDLSTNSVEFKDSSEQWGASAQLDWDLGFANLTYIPSYRDFSSTGVQDDYTSLRLYTVGAGGQNSRAGIAESGTDIQTQTHEVRLQGNAFERLDWLVGAFFGKEDISSVASTTLGPDYQAAVSMGNFGTVAGVNPLLALTALGNGGVPVNANGAFAVNAFEQEGETFSIFTHNVFDITDKWSVTLGARYVEESKDASYDQVSASNPACQASINGVLTGAVPAALRSGLVGLNCFFLVTPVDATAPASVGGGAANRLLPLVREWKNTFEDEALTYTGQISYKPTEDTLVYASFSHGFKSGGFNLDATAAALINSAAVLAGTAAPVYADPRFNSEEVDATEIGFKGTFGRFNTNVAIFNMEMSDFQVLEFTGVQFATFNVHGARSQGIEVEAFGRVTDYVTINASGTYVHARYDDDCATGISAANLASVSRLCGFPLTNAPRFAAVAGVTYDGPLRGSEWGLLANLNAQYADRRRTSTQALDTNLTPLPLDYQGDSLKFNARLGIRTPGDRYSFELWGTNITNEITRSITANTPLRGGAGTRSRIAFVEEPRMYGLTVRTNF